MFSQGWFSPELLWSIMNQFPLSYISAKAAPVMRRTEQRPFSKFLPGHGLNFQLLLLAVIWLVCMFPCQAPGKDKSDMNISYSGAGSSSPLEGHLDFKDDLDFSSGNMSVPSLPAEVGSSPDLWKPTVGSWTVPLQGNGVGAAARMADNLPGLVSLGLSFDIPPSPGKTVKLKASFLAEIYNISNLAWVLAVPPPYRLTGGESSGTIDRLDLWKPFSLDFSVSCDAPSDSATIYLITSVPIDKNALASWVEDKAFREGKSDTSDLAKRVFALGATLEAGTFVTPCSGPWESFGEQPVMRGFFPFSSSDRGGPALVTLDFDPRDSQACAMAAQEALDIRKFMAGEKKSANLTDSSQTANSDDESPFAGYSREALYLRYLELVYQTGLGKAMEGDDRADEILQGVIRNLKGNTEKNPAEKDSRPGAGLSDCTREDLLSMAIISRSAVLLGQAEKSGKVTLVREAAGALEDVAGMMSSCTSERWSRLNLYRLYNLALASEMQLRKGSKGDHGALARDCYRAALEIDPYFLAARYGLEALDGKSSRSRGGK